jgi:hypothetical protein
MKKGGLGISGTVSAFLTVLLLVAGFAVSTGLLSAIYSVQSEVLRKAVNVGEAVSERLQAFVYEDVRTNRTLLTVRNVGSVGSEVEYLMGVGYNGNVLKEVRLNDTIKLGTQQAYTTYLSNLLGNEFNNYTDVRSRMAVLYLKTFKGGVFGSAYMAPPSVMTAAYATSTTTLSSTETSTETVAFWTGETTITTWTATVIVSNPDRWPVNAYVGVAFMRNMPTSVDHTGWTGSLNVGMGGSSSPRGGPGDTGFPSWGWQPGLKATDQNGQVRDVTPSDIRLPKYVACANKNDNSGGSFTAWTGAARTMLVLVSFSELGPKYLVKHYSERSPNTPNIGAVPICGFETFIPHGVTMRLIGPMTAVFPISTFVTTTNTPSTYTTWYTTTTTATITMTTYYWVWTTITTTGFYRTYTRTEYVPTAMTYTRTTTQTLTTQHATTTGIPATITTTQYGTLSAGRSTDVGDNQVFTFPGRIYAVTDAWNSGWYYYKIAYKLAYIKVVNYWNTTETLAYTDGSSTLYVRADRPLGIAAVYVFDDVSETRPPPPPPPPSPGPCVEIRANPYCVSDDAEGKVDVQSPPYYQVPCGSPYGTTITATTNDKNCEGFITTVPSGPVTVNQATPCPKNGNTISCELTDPSQRAIIDCDH